MIKDLSGLTTTLKYSLNNCIYMTMGYYVTHTAGIYDKNVQKKLWKQKSNFRCKQSMIPLLFV